MTERLLRHTCISIFLDGYTYMGFPGGTSGKESTCQCRRRGFNPCVGKIPWRRKCKPLQYSCLGNPMDRGARQAMVHGGHKDSDITKSEHTRTHTSYMHISTDTDRERLQAQINHECLFPLIHNFSLNIL